MGAGRPLPSVYPEALQDAPPPRAGYYSVDGVDLYTESRGTGQPVIVIGAVSEDAEMYLPIAERLPGRTVVTYDPRGTQRSRSHARSAGGSASCLSPTGRVR
jgi:hypothetical protein